MNTRKIAGLFFVGLFGVYLSLSPASIWGSGYSGEEIESGLQMLAIVNAWAKARPIPPMAWTRHGPLPILLDLPFIKLGKYLGSPDWIMSFQSVLLTAALITVLFLWLRKLCSPRMSLTLSLSAAFGTMLWPYAYIGLETKQSFMVLFAGYLALARGKIEGWRRIIFFAVVCGLSIGVKSTGVTLWPVVAYLIYVQFGERWRTRWVEALVVIGVIGSMWFAASSTRNMYWASRGGGFASMKPWMIDSVFQCFTNVIGFFGSPTKGALVYSPIILVSIYALPRALKRNRQIAVYVLLVVACTVAFMSLIRMPSDETWGGRYAHVLVAPLVLSIGAAWPRFEWRRHFTVILLALVGLPVAFLGSFFFYGTFQGLMIGSGQSTMEWIHGDSTWSNVTTSARLFSVWLEDSPNPVLWTGNHVWVWERPAGAVDSKTVDLRSYARPQAFLIVNWRAKVEGMRRSMLRLYETSLLVGFAALLAVIVLSFREPLSFSGDPLTGSLK